MSTAEKYFKEQMKSEEFERAYLDEKTRLDIGITWKSYRGIFEHGATRMN